MNARSHINVCFCFFYSRSKPTKIIIKSMNVLICPALPIKNDKNLACLRVQSTRRDDVKIFRYVFFANSASYPKFSRFTLFYRFLLDSRFHKHVLILVSTSPTLRVYL